MSGVVSWWLGGVDALDDIAQRLLRVQIENRPAINVINLYDSDTTLFYCDPPYLHETRGDDQAYGYEMSNLQHKDLAIILNNCQAKVALSGYDCDAMNDLYPSDKWLKTVGKERTIHSTKGKRTEVLWINYNPVQK
jgi:DNA adenine methylase